MPLSELDQIEMGPHGKHQSSKKISKSVHAVEGSESLTASNVAAASKICCWSTCDRPHVVQWLTIYECKTRVIKIAPVSGAGAPLDAEIVRGLGVQTVQQPEYITGTSATCHNRHRAMYTARHPHTLVHA
ncbi:hypothetical protein EVAR_29784_1 [Eumeta japonica]|uniref:Uncharacterized protein n=1 Tax=Eumeta variegata TaxID=151549 RepID=A0A4C1XPP1_EUMVA|nr:hypothetical protein EVAR_29784_1 [Eumeta japonica]